MLSIGKLAAGGADYYLEEPMPASSAVRCWRHSKA